MSKNIITAAQIGCGKFSWHQDLVNMTNHPQVNLKWACDLRKENAQKAADHFNIPCVTAVNIATAISFPLEISDIAKTHNADKSTPTPPRIIGIRLSDIFLLFLIPVPIRYNTGIRINNSGLINSSKII